jgi:hypothetical protein
LQILVSWKLSDQFSIAGCESEEEVVIHHDLLGDMHIVSGFGFFLLQLFKDKHCSVEELVDLVSSSFEIDPELELKAEIEKVMRQLYGLGIIVPCPINVA